MVLFFKPNDTLIIAVNALQKLKPDDLGKLTWLFNQARFIDRKHISRSFIGPRKEMLTPWSTNAVEITQNMGIEGIQRIEQFQLLSHKIVLYDPMLQQKYEQLDQHIFDITRQPEKNQLIANIERYNQEEGLALSEDEVAYLEQISRQMGRKLTDSEVYGFAQVNSEHCRHKIFNGQFIIDGNRMDESLFSLIKKTSRINPNYLVSAYTDNVAFIQGPDVEQFAPKRQDVASNFETRPIQTVLSLKAETHNFPTTVEPFFGASTGSGGEIRDRLAGGKGSQALAGTAVYMTSYPRLAGGRSWESKYPERKWLYQSPLSILVKASNGASDFGNKYGQPLINGSILTYEHQEHKKTYGYDKVVMLAGGVGFAKTDDAEKGKSQSGDLIVLLGGDNYRIGMGGGAVSSVATGEFGQAIELNAVQRANPEMQKRVANVIRAMAEDPNNPIVSVHDHGAGGHLNSLSELVEETGGLIDIAKLPVGDPTLSEKEILGNESQERMGLVIRAEHKEKLEKVARRERAPFYVVGEVTGDQVFRVKGKSEVEPFHMKLEDLFGKPPKTVLYDDAQSLVFKNIKYSPDLWRVYLNEVLQLEAVACKDWLTNKVDRSVTGKVAKQQTAGDIQLPINNLGVTALDYAGKKGIATALGHAPAPALIDPGAGSRLALTEALSNVIWAPLSHGLKGVSLSANWMWPAKNPGENKRLYQAVKALSDFAIELGINIPTGKDSLSMIQKYPDGQTVYSPGTVIVSAVGEVSDITRVVEPVARQISDSIFIYIPLSHHGFKLGGSSLAQVLNQLGDESPDLKEANYLKQVFDIIQQLIADDQIIAGHDVSAGGLITCLLEMNFPNWEGGMHADLSKLGEELVPVLFAENPALVIQTPKDTLHYLKLKRITAFEIAKPTPERKLQLSFHEQYHELDINELRDVWYTTSYLLDSHQSGEKLALERFKNYKKQELNYNFPGSFDGKKETYGLRTANNPTQKIQAAIIREKGVNGDREMAYAMYLAGFDVKDIHMTDLISGRETLEDVHFIVFVGGFSNSDVLGSAKGWAGAFLFNPKAKQALESFYERNNTLSLGVCNGCQLMAELNLIYPGHPEPLKLEKNNSGKFESAFLTVDICDNRSVMLSSLSGARLGIWVAHGEGKFVFPYFRDKYEFVMKYSYDEYPGNPNGSDWETAAVCSNDGRHLAMMPHLERAIFPWQWAHYPKDKKEHEVSPWLEAFVNARKWIEKNKCC